MKIYISHSTGFDFKNELYKPLKESDLAKRHEFIFPHDVDALYPTKELFGSKDCDLVLAEVSYPSTGQGIELAWADASSIKVICIYKEGFKFSGSLKTVASEFLVYKNSADFITKLSSILNV